MAAFPTGWSSPRFVTRPTPSPPSMCTPGSSVRRTEAKMSVPFVTSGSSPLSFSMAQETLSARIVISRTASSSRMPFGVSSVMVSFLRPVSSIHAAALAAAAAHEPVVYPSRRRLPSFSMYCSILPQDLIEQRVADGGGDVAAALAAAGDDVRHRGIEEELLALHHVHEPDRHADDERGGGFSLFHQLL